MFPLQVKVKLTKVFCHRDGDFFGSAEPYLWTVFFKVDGETAQLIDDNGTYRLSGTGTVRSTPGSHGNLGATDVDDNDVINIPPAIGEWDSSITPIPVPAGLQSLFPDGLPGMIGVISILMEEDNVSDHGAEEGHKALNEGIQRALNTIIPTISLSNLDITDDIAEVESSIKGAIVAAIQAHQSWLENFWSFLNPDDTIGVRTFMFRHDELEANPEQGFSQRWENEGDWEISGFVKALGGPKTRLLVTVDKVKIVDKANALYINTPPTTVKTRFFAGVNGEFRAYPLNGDFDFPNNEWVELPKPGYTFSKTLWATEKLTINLHATLPGIVTVSGRPPVNYSKGDDRQLKVINEFLRTDRKSDGTQISRAYGEGSYTVRSNNNSGHIEVVYRIQLQEITKPTPTGNKVKATN